MAGVGWLCAKTRAGAPHGELPGGASCASARAAGERPDAQPCNVRGAAGRGTGARRGARRGHTWVQQVGGPARQGAARGRSKGHGVGLSNNTQSSGRGLAGAGLCTVIVSVMGQGCVRVQGVGSALASWLGPQRGARASRGRARARTQAVARSAALAAGGAGERSGQCEGSKEEGRGRRAAWGAWCVLLPRGRAGRAAGGRGLCTVDGRSGPPPTGAARPGVACCCYCGCCCC
jgi:hypothetical protein